MRAALLVVTGIVLGACSQSTKGIDSKGGGGGGGEPTVAETTEPNGNETEAPIADTGPAGLAMDPRGGDDIIPGLLGGAADTGLVDLAEEYCDPALPLAESLDLLQSPDDEHVLYCHSADGITYSLVDSDLSSCNGHQQHDFDILPTRGCAD